MNVGTLKAQLGLDSSSFRKDLKKSEDSTSKSTGRMAGSFKKLGGALAGAFAFGAIVKGVGSVISAASDLGESVNAVEVTFEDSAAAVLKLSDASAKTYGLSKKDFNGMSVQMSAFAKSVAGDGGDVAGTLDEMITRSSDFASVMNLEVADAAALMQSGLAGEAEGLRKYGVDVSAAAVETYAYANGIGEAGTALSEQQKIQARYGLIMEQTAKVQGDFANTSDSLANRQRILSASFEDAKARLGASFLPIMEKAVGFMQTAFLPIILSLAAAIEDWGGTVERTKAGIKKWVDDLGPVATVLKGIAGLIATVMIPHFVALGVNSAIAGAKVVASWVMMQLAAIKSAVIHGAQILLTIGKFALMSVQALLHGAKVVASWVMMGAQALLQAGRMAIQAARVVASWVLMGVQSLIQAGRMAAAWLIAMGPVGWVITTVVALAALIIANWDKISAGTKRIWSSMITWLTDAWKGAKDTVLDTASDIWNGLTSGADRMVNNVGAAFGRLKSALAAPVNWVIRNVINNGILKAWNTVAEWIPGMKKAAPVGEISNGGGAGGSRSGAQAFAKGGRVPGEARGDSVAAKLTPGEFVIRRAAAKALGLDTLGALNRAEQWYGGDPGLPGLGRIAAYAEGGPVGKAKAFARSQNGKPYGWGNSGPGSYDCSGFLSAIANVLSGKSNPYSRIFATGMTRPGKGFGPFAPGMGPGAGFNIGVVRGSPGHAAGTLGGMNVEASGGKGVSIGGNARGATNGLFSDRYHFTGGGGGGGGGLMGFLRDGLVSIVEKLLKPALEMAKAFSDPTGIVAGLAEAVVGKIRNFIQTASFDSGGYLQPGLTLAYNGTGRPERVIGPNGSGGGSSYSSYGSTGFNGNVAVYIGGEKIDERVDVKITRFDRSLRNEIAAA